MVSLYFACILMHYSAPRAFCAYCLTQSVERHGSFYVTSNTRFCMFLHIPSVITQEELATVRDALTTAEFQDGKATASGPAQLVKNNAQLIPSQIENLSDIDAIITQALARNPLLNAVLLPRYFVPLRISRYDVGMSYGWHVDGPIMEQAPPVRTDISLTLFLNNPNEYEGGELIIRSDLGDVPYKLNAGDAIAYPSQYLHRVAEVHTGSRLVAVTWIQSAVRDMQQRTLLFQLNTLCSMESAKAPHSDETKLAFQVYSNLVRMWCEA